MFPKDKDDLNPLKTSPMFSLYKKISKLKIKEWVCHVSSKSLENCGL